MPRTDRRFEPSAWWPRPGDYVKAVTDDGVVEGWMRRWRGCVVSPGHHLVLGVYPNPYLSDVVVLHTSQIRSITVNRSKRARKEER